VTRRAAEIIDALKAEPHAATLQIAIIGTVLLSIIELTGDDSAPRPEAMQAIIGPVAKLVSHAMTAHIQLGGDAMIAMATKAAAGKRVM
jgi:hypothetical protein